jgi:hypothetical protein
MITDKELEAWESLDENSENWPDAYPALKQLIAEVRRLREENARLRDCIAANPTVRQAAADLNEWEPDELVRTEP